jgi:hypothetical protein
MAARLPWAIRWACQARGSAAAPPSTLPQVMRAMRWPACAWGVGAGRRAGVRAGLTKLRHCLIVAAQNHYFSFTPFRPTVRPRGHTGPIGWARSMSGSGQEPSRRFATENTSPSRRVGRSSNDQAHCRSGNCTPTFRCPSIRARAMPKSVYTSAEFLEQEQKHVFAHDWLSAGRADALAKPRRTI